MIIAETWLHALTPDATVELTGRSALWTFFFDRNTESVRAEVEESVSRYTMTGA